ncbi:MAG: hypothetical protein H6Q68_357 [Firmicutes bacterium]|nr:hypothetical protein [Bacillota bacterium]
MQITSLTARKAVFLNLMYGKTAFSYEKNLFTILSDSQRNNHNRLFFPPEI